MRYFSGFGFGNEAELFGEWIPHGDTVVAGFSYGAQRALEYVLASSRRVDRLVLLSPAFFHDKNDAFVRLQLKHFKRDAAAYAEAFYANVAAPASIELSPYKSDMHLDDLQRLLTYRWEEEALRRIADRGTTIEVVLGGDDRIINAQAACDFFAPLVDATYLIKNAGHLLRTIEDLDDV